MRLSLAAARKYVLIICIHLLVVISVHMLFLESYVASLSDEGAVYLDKSVV